jgi:LPS-assembly lipoprotein
MHNSKMVSPAGYIRRVVVCLLAVCLVTVLSGCGFHLRGSGALPAEMSVTYIQSGNPFSSLVDDFADALRSSGAQVTEERDKATAVLRILENDRGREVLSVNTSGKVLEYQLWQTVRFSVATMENLPVVEPQTVTLRRAYLYSSTDVLGSEREKEAVRSTLQRNLVHMAMLRVAAAAR